LRDLKIKCWDEVKVLKNKYKAVCFDMDGTFFQNIKSIDYLCIINNKEKELKDLEIMERKDRISWIKSDYLRVKLLENFEKSILKDKLENEFKLNNGIKECIEFIKNNNMKVFIITSGSKEVAKLISDKYLIDKFYGSEYEIKGDKFTGEIDNHLDGEAKLDKLKEICKEYKFKPKDCIAIGDSISDVNIFENVGLKIAINFTNVLIGRADEYIATNDLNDVIKSIKKFIE
jgi:phosphoserine phosphatase